MSKFLRNDRVPCRVVFNADDGCRTAREPNRARSAAIFEDYRRLAPFEEGVDLGDCRKIPPRQIERGHILDVVNREEAPDPQRRAVFNAAALKTCEHSRIV